jgi:hypothetical protein
MTTPPTEATQLHHIGVEAFGVRTAIAASSPELLTRVQAILPPCSGAIEPTQDDVHFILRARENGSFVVEHREGPDAQGGSVSGSSDLQVALEVLGTRLRAYIALHAPARIFVHAGVVGHQGRAIVLPGPSFSGKTTLVAELVQAGAAYYSDEFAVLDVDGLVHPYPKPLSIRVDGRAQTDHDPAGFGGIVGEGPLPIGLIAITQFGHGNHWRPVRLSAGESVLAMLANTVPAQDRPEQALAAIRRAVDKAVVLQGERGEAAEIVGELLGGVVAQPPSTDQSSNGL